MFDINSKSINFIFLTLLLGLSACSKQVSNPAEGDGTSTEAAQNQSSGNGSGGYSSSGSSGTQNPDGGSTGNVPDNSIVRFVAAEKLNLLDDTPFVYIARSVSQSAATNEENFKALVENSEKAPVELSSPYRVNPGSKLVFRSSLDSDAVDIDILTGYFESQDYDVKDLNVSPDGKHLVFAAHGPDDHPHDYTWNIYELGFESGLMRRIIKDDAIANAGEDTSPTYTLDGSIVFSTDRAVGNPDNPIRFCDSIGPDEKPSLLHSMSASGENIVQLTYGLSHDIKTTTLKDGRIGFVRWSKSYKRAPECDADEIDGEVLSGQSFEEYFNQTPPAGLSTPDAWPQESICNYAKNSPFGPVIASNTYTLLRMSADGTDMDQLYDKVSNSGSDGEFLTLSKLVQGESGRLVTLIKHEYSPFSGGSLVELQAPASAGSNGVFSNLAPRTLTSREANLYPNQLSTNGWYSAVWPYRDGTSRYLVSWAQCLTVENGVNAFCVDGEEVANTDTRYGIWVYDPKSDSRLPILRARQDIVYSELALAQPHQGNDMPHAEYAADYVDDTELSRVASSETSRLFPVVLRDFLQEHPDFEEDGGQVDYGIVADVLGSDNKPVYARESGSSPTTSGADNFNQWYNTIEDVNIEVPMTFELSREIGSSLWTYTDSSFFPLDGLGWDAIATPESEVFDYPEDYIHNYHFTLEAHLEFDYLGGEEFSFSGDDDLWVFINGKLAIDIGGVHGPLDQSINLDEMADELDIEIGKRYNFDLFFAERHLVESNFRFQTSINLDCVYYPEQEISTN